MKSTNVFKERRETMRFPFLMAAVLISFIGVSSEAYAQVKKKPAVAEVNPCTTVKKACEAAGFKRGGYEPRKNLRKGLYRDCIRPLLDGEVVKGVRVDSRVIAACKARKKKD
jgi:hypothetical protein